MASSLRKLVSVNATEDPLAHIEDAPEEIDIYTNLEEEEKFKLEQTVGGIPEVDRLIACKMPMFTRAYDKTFPELKTARISVDASIFHSVLVSPANTIPTAGEAIEREFINMNFTLLSPIDLSTIIGEGIQTNVREISRLLVRLKQLREEIQVIAVKIDEKTKLVDKARTDAYSSLDSSKNDSMIIADLELADLQQTLNQLRKEADSTCEQMDSLKTEFSNLGQDDTGDTRRGNISMSSSTPAIKSQRVAHTPTTSATLKGTKKRSLAPFAVSLNSQITATTSATAAAAAGSPSSMVSPESVQPSKQGRSNFSATPVTFSLSSTGQRTSVPFIPSLAPTKDHRAMVIYERSGMKVIECSTVPISNITIMMNLRCAHKVFGLANSVRDWMNENSDRLLAELSTGVIPECPSVQWTCTAKVCIRLSEEVTGKIRRPDDWVFASTPVVSSPQLGICSPNIPSKSSGTAENMSFDVMVKVPVTVTAFITPKNQRLVIDIKIDRCEVPHPLIPSHLLKFSVRRNIQIIGDKRTTLIDTPVFRMVKNATERFVLARGGSTKTATINKITSSKSKDGDVKFESAITLLPADAYKTAIAKVQASLDAKKQILARQMAETSASVEEVDKLDTLIVDLSTTIRQIRELKLKEGHATARMMAGSTTVLARKLAEARNVEAEINDGVVEAAQQRLQQRALRKATLENPEVMAKMRDGTTDNATRAAVLKEQKAVAKEAGMAARVLAGEDTKPGNKVGCVVM
jgi:hypothetical protein